jgi:uncharacterized protein YjiS (DUF1127 family)
MLIWQQMIRHWVDWRMQQRQLQELRSYLANDHRAAADIGITSCEAQRLLNRPLRRNNSSLRADSGPKWPAR